MSIWDTLQNQVSTRYAQPQLNTTQADADQGRSLQSRAQMQTLNQSLRQAALGQGTSAAQQQLQMGSEQALHNAQSMAAGASGANAALAQRNAMFAGASAQQQANAQAAQVRAQEAQNAQGLLAQNLQSQRMADLQSRGYSLDEAKALMNAQMDTNARNTALGIQNEQNRNAFGKKLINGALSGALGAGGLFV